MLDEIINYVQSLQRQVEVTFISADVIGLFLSIYAVCRNIILCSNATSNLQFLSMKLATVNPELGFDIEQILSKQVNSLYNHPKYFQRFLDPPAQCNSCL
jgi:hypothetical protein